LVLQLKSEIRERAMAHMIWKGAISFGLVHVPVQLYPATQSEQVGFNLLDRRSIDPIGYRQINKRTGKEVARENIVRGFEYEKDKYVVMSDAEIRAANPESTQTVDILAFVEAPGISFLYLDTPYYLTPDRKGEKVYALLREALKESGKVGIANVVMHNKQHLAALIPIGPVLALNTLRWAGEVRSYDELKLPDENPKKAGVTPRELGMAKKLIDDMSDVWDPSAYRDTFHDDIMALVERKIRAGKTEEIGEVEEAGETRPSADILDLSELLKRSIGRDKGKAARKPPAKTAGKAGGKPAGQAAAKAAKAAARARANSDEDAADEAEEAARPAPRRAAKSTTPARRTAGTSSARKRRAA
jgi:DNA end-binding protein Ku